MTLVRSPKTYRWVVAILAMSAALFGGWLLRRPPLPSTPASVDRPPVATSERSDHPDAHPSRAPTRPPDDERTSRGPSDDSRADVARFLITTRDGRPIAGARLHLRPAEAEPLLLVTDNDGRTQTPGPLPPRTLSATVTATGFVRQELSIGIDEDRDFHVALMPGIMLTGRVFDGPTGRPIAGAAVEARDGSHGTVGATTSDLDGRFTLIDVPPYPRFLGVVRAKAHVEQSFELVEDLPIPVSIWLEPCGRLVGTVSGPGGLPAANAIVSVVPRDPLARRRLRDSQAQRATTDTAGDYELDGLQLGVPYCIDVTAEGLAGPALTDDIVATQSSSEIRRDLLLRRAATLVVETRDSAGRSLVGAAVSIHRLSEPRNVVTLTGQVEAIFRDLEPGLIRVHVAPESDATTSVDVDVPEGGSTSLTITLPDAPLAAGVIVDDMERPISDATIAIDERLRCGCTRTIRCSTSSRGAFRILGDNPALQELIATAPRHSRVSLTFTPPSPLLRVVLPRTGHLRFRPRWPPGEAPLIGWSWACLTEDRAQLCYEWLPDLPSPAHLTIDAPVATRRLRIESSGFVALEREVRIGPDETTDIGEVVLDAGVTLHGSAVDRDGHQVRIRRVQALVGPTRDIVAATVVDTEGPFELRGLPRMPLIVHVEANGFVDSDVHIDEDQLRQPVAVVLSRGSYVRVRVVDHAGLSGCDALIAVGPDGATPDVLDEFSPGVFLGRLPAGRWRFVATRSGAQSEVSADLTEDGMQDLTLRLDN